MKRFFGLFALMFVMVVSAPHAEAKKFGGGKSFGKSFKTAPAPKSQPTNTNSLNKQNDPASAAKSSSRKGMLGGLMGGLLAGGLIAAMFGGAFDGFQMMDFLIIAVIAFVLFKIFKSLMAAKNGAISQPNRQAYAGNSQQKSNGYYHEQPQSRESTATSSTGGFGAVNNDVPFNFPPNFDMAGFVNGSREHYRILQGAWNHNQLETIQEYVTPELYNDLSEERSKLSGEQQTEVMYVDAEIVRADYDNQRAQLSLQFSGRYRDGQEGVEEDITDIWHLERDMTQANSPWLIVGIQA
ncbi:preprotein translocase subunit Tim44 [Enterovibrio norvegicus FF-33]|uniref:Preprotein translocase subunit Tim44 n=1 Tax=Enterovibrio norvegicus FF-454 TaxID=1185651 RepID=A0A1E5BZY5_9GAMM|nr:TIM44-like domain-containing protein [Enterovibrio norvegicus]OEE58813.1 preprotein translocase subunit Tim44 [Enterovibrio norvegicus FF-454]OEE68032.1 preprotein translocase subunit Tim44 [Enterovibrio norvegicus FF-33]OEE74166.1 preprotein translocase subunit Tim44 [Enterovibrio norvegicus FF-162]